MNEKTRSMLVEAFRYSTSEEPRHAFREILGMALQLGLEIRWIPRGNMKYAFRLGSGRFPVCDVCQQWVSVYTTSHNPLHVVTVDDVIPGIFRTKAAVRLKNGE